MKILFVCNEYPPAPHGGIGTFVLTIAHKLSEAGNQVFVIGYDESILEDETYYENGVHIFKLVSPSKNKKTFMFRQYRFSFRMIMDRIYLSKRINDLIKTHKIDLVESHDWNGPLWSKPKIPLIVRLHGANSANRYFEQMRLSRLISYFEKQNIKMADKLIAVSDHIGRTTLDALQIKNKKFDVIHNGIDTNLFRNLNIDRSKDEILFVGSVSRRKGIYELFKAYNLVLQQKPKTKLKIVGSLPEGEKKEVFISDLLSNIPEDRYSNVSFLGRIPFETLPEHYNHATLAVFPSLAEAFGLTCAEAMACGTPVIMTNKASGPELVEDAKSGCLVNVKNPERFSGKILELLSNPELNQKIGKEARLRVEEKFDLDKLIFVNLEYYSKILKTNG